jgi:hypothetical protein
MGQLFSSPKSIKLPPIPEPEAVPQLSGEEEEKPRKKRRGRTETIITGELEPVTTKKTLLG